MALIDRVAEKKQAEQDTEDLIRSRGLTSEQDIGSSAAATAASRGRFAAGIPKLAESIAARTGGVDSGVGAAAAAPFVEDLKRIDDEQNSLRRVREKRDTTNKLFNFMADRLEQAGMDRAEAETAARQFALDEDQRSAVATENEYARDLAKRKQEVMDTYSDRILEARRRAAEEQQKDMFKSSIYKSLFGLAGMGIGAALAAPTGGMSLAAGATLGGMAGGMSGDVVSKANVA